MGILTRFKDIMSSNINALLDKCEDPEKMIDQLLRNLNQDLGNVKSETASVMADAKRAERAVNEIIADIEKQQSFAEKAVLAGNDADARAFLTRKTELETRKTTLDMEAETTKQSAEQMKQLNDKLIADIKVLETKRDALKSKLKVASAQEKINKMTSSIGDANSSMDAFSRLEEKVNKKLDTANAMSELNAPKDELKDLESKYSSTPTTAVEDDLAALKAKLGK